MTWDLVAQIVVLSLVAWVWLVSVLYALKPITPKSSGCYMDMRGELHHVTEHS